MCGGRRPAAASNAEREHTRGIKAAASITPNVMLALAEAT
jgi:hypothetical protein